MDVICFLNEKGGTGKTSTSVTLAALFAQAGKRTLLLDLDSQGHATLATRVKREDRLYHMLVNDAPFKDVIVPVPVEFTDGDLADPLLYVVPSADGTLRLDNEAVDIHALQRRVWQLEKVFDTVIIDTSPKIGRVHLMAYLTANHLIYPTEMTYLPIQGLFSSLAHHARMVQEGYNIGQIMGILPTRYNPRRKIQKQNLARLEEQYPQHHFFSPLKFLTAWDEAGQMRRPINRVGYDNDAAPEAERFAREVMHRLEMLQHA